MNLLEGQVAIVTGAGNGIGAAVVELLAQEGAQVVVNDLGTHKDGSGSDPTVADRVADELNATGRHALASHHDVTVGSEANALVRAAIEHFGQLDALINCAGIQGDHALLNMDESTWTAIINAQLTGTFNCLRAAAAAMRTNKNGGRIVNTTSTAGLLGNFGQSSASAAAAGVYGLTRTAAIELQRHGIMVNAVAPLARTRQTEELPMFQKSNALTPAHVAPAYLFLASKLAGDLTGQVLAAAGGRISVYRMTDTHSRFKDEEAGIWTAEEIAQEFSDLARV
jgi:NAD(P)-dependent dehydrogenase (short-subunit alcohol dehydrogenase family)